VRVIYLSEQGSEIIPLKACVQGYREKFPLVSSLLYRERVSYTRQDFTSNQIILGKCRALRRYLSASLHKARPFPAEFKSISPHKHKGTSSRESDKININPMTCYPTMYPLYLSMANIRENLKQRCVAVIALFISQLSLLSIHDIT